MVPTPPPRKPKNIDRRAREFLTPEEVERLVLAAKKYCRHAERDSLAILMMFRHGLRVGELVAVKWEQLDLEGGLFYVQRSKRGKPSTQHLSKQELKSLRQLKKITPNQPYVFMAQTRKPLSTSSVRKMVAQVGREAGIPFPIHPHMLRHATGYKLANDGIDTRGIQDYLGHRLIQHTVRYTELSSERFKDFFKD